ncbi:Chitin synthase, class 5 [Physocladia obscura]|uniref:Chitin synthase, class 5 n=1 Tax=Physocladia obscura TaxID=109957 RepID=A0AAD5XG72_9FUNG|nr:Chitin synthase, class 5 [Physocladia obscura]
MHSPSHASHRATQPQFTEVVSQEFTVGKVDAGMAILLSHNHHLIEFPATILPDGVTTGSIINITVERNHDEERRKREEFLDLQDQILAQFAQEPEVPILTLKSVTQTSAIVSWKPLVLNNATLKGIDIYRNNQKTSFNVPLTAVSAKLSGLEINHDYDVHLVIRTSAGTYESNKINFKTHTLDNLTGINVSFGHLTNPTEAANLIQLIKRIGAKYTEELSTDNTHLICVYAKGPKYEKAKEWSIPCVSPEFLKACEGNSRIMPSHSYYVEASE